MSYTNDLIEKLIEEQRKTNELLKTLLANFKRNQ